MNELKIKNSYLKLIIVTCLLVALLSTVIINIDIDEYLKIIILPFGLVLESYIFLIKKLKLENNKKAYVLIVPILLMLLSDIIVGIDESNKILNVMILPILITIFVFTIINKKISISKESLLWIFKLFPNGILSNQKYLKRLFDNIENSNLKIAINILIGIIIGSPIALAILYLLSNADKYFNEFVGFIWKLVTQLLNADFIISNTITFIFLFVIVFSVFLNVYKNKSLESKEIKKKDISKVIISTVLIILNTIFILFTISEISKLTGNFLHLPIEYTYAEYAREGFFQLLMVTAINFATIVYCLYFTKVIDNKFIKNLLLLIITFSILLIFNSYYRMFLYIGEYGFTILRLQVILFLAMELISFIFIIRKMMVNYMKEEQMILLTILVFYLINVYFCTDNFVKFLNIF